MNDLEAGNPGKICMLSYKAGAHDYTNELRHLPLLNAYSSA